MSISMRMIVTALVVVLGSQSPASAQWRDGPKRGLFGDREFGQPLKPRTSQFGSGLERGPSGNFVGRTNSSRATTFRSKSPAEPQTTPLIPPEAYYLEPDMVPAYLAEQARRAAEMQAQAQSQAAAPVPGQPAPYPPEQPILPEQPPLPGMPTLEPGMTREQLQSSPDRWFRGGTNPAQPGQPTPPAGPAQPGQPGAAAPLTPPPAMQRSYLPRPTLGPTGTLGAPPVGGPMAVNATPLGMRITRQLGPRALSPISAVYQGDTVTLQGRVAADSDRAVAEQIARFEPGVRRVVNQLSVEAPQPVPQPVP